MIVIVDDRPDVTAAYCSSFGREGVAAASFTSGDFDGWFQATSAPDLAAVEAYVLGEFDRREVMARAIKTRATTPAIALNDTPGLDNILKLFAAGVDDVVRKPVHARELIARVAAIRRRGAPVEGPSIMGSLHVYSDGRDPEVNGAAIVLPRRERRILEYLASN
jgi:DNA-binding response OmpR family regulator